MSEYQLVVSICIPTFNRAYLLRDTLKHLFRQIEEDEIKPYVEVIICDNASTDETQKVVGRYIKEGKYQIVYHKNEINLGVIRNILKTVELSNANYWMFYGDDDVIPKGALKKVIAGFLKFDKNAAFMFKWPKSQDHYTNGLLNECDLSIAQLATDFFYYVGNAGIFAVKTCNAKQIAAKYSTELVKTCWPQTMILFLSVHLSENKNLKFLNITTSIPPDQGIVISNSFYLFETTIYSLLRTALSIEKEIGCNFTEKALNSVYGIQNFKAVKETIMELYSFFDSDKQRLDFKLAVNEARKDLPKKYQKETLYFYRSIELPNFINRITVYGFYFSSLSFSELQTTLLNKIKIMSPFGFMAMLRLKREQLARTKVEFRRTDVDANNGYF